jgi:hypothetical protein
MASSHTVEFAQPQVMLKFVKLAKFAFVAMGSKCPYSHKTIHPTPLHGKTNITQIVKQGEVQCGHLTTK